MESLISKNYLSLRAARKSGTEGELQGFSFSFRRDVQGVCDEGRLCWGVDRSGAAWAPMR